MQLAKLKRNSVTVGKQSSSRAETVLTKTNYKPIMKDFDPTFDYYDLFEAVMGSPELEEVMEDSEDYVEFIEVLRTGLWSPN